MARDSFEELRYIFNWSLTNKDYRSGDIVLIGGWAVHSYNPWKYSLDIDLIATDRFKDSLKNHLYLTHGYGKERDHEGNTLYRKSLLSGDIFLDFLPNEYKFNGTAQSLNLSGIKYGTVSKTISYAFEAGFQVIVPEISMLLLLKLKAAWDRHYDLSHGTTLNKDHLKEKFIKDCGDIIALIQCDAFQFARFDWLSSVISGFDFLRDFLEQGIIENNSTFDRVPRKEAKALVKKLLSLI